MGFLRTSDVVMFYLALHIGGEAFATWYRNVMHLDANYVTHINEKAAKKRKKELAASKAKSRSGRR